MLLLAGFALAALLLAGVGIYGTVSQAVAQRTQEIGVRMALGASPGAVLRLVFGEGLRMMAAGSLAGSARQRPGVADARACCLKCARSTRLHSWARRRRWRYSRRLACYVPARRATRVDPLVALRQE